ncbi:PhzF family phenazine biosynthesis protein [Lysinibacillus xylanilyticus]|uniref:PhzF family phenazine biosynthesis protein n=1 Tax=Lysinibacillus xylanilyticus TaxID=582475 RepID=UPI003D03B363
MKIVTVHHYDAFSTIPNKGNPAGVVVEGDQYSEVEMQDIAKQVGFNFFQRVSNTCTCR